jgi:WD40 repeat protein
LGSADHTLIAWNLQSQEIVQTLYHTDAVYAIAVITTDIPGLVSGNLSPNPNPGPYFNLSNANRIDSPSFRNPNPNPKPYPNLNLNPNPNPNLNPNPNPLGGADLVIRIWNLKTG